MPSSTVRRTTRTIATGGASRTPMTPSVICAPLPPRRAGARFTSAPTPALDICSSCPDDFDALSTKLAQLASARVRRFALFFDDAPETPTHAEDVAHYGGSDAAALARAHADLVNRV